MSKPKGNIKTAFIHHFNPIAAGVHQVENAADTFIAPDDIKVVGIELVCEPWAEATGWDSGWVEAQAEVSKVGDMQSDGVLISNTAYVDCHEAVVGAGTTEVVVGGGVKTERVMFPTGSAVYMDEDEVLYLNTNSYNTMANQHGCYYFATIYYVER